MTSHYKISEVQDKWGNCHIQFNGSGGKFNLARQPGLLSHRGGWLRVLEGMLDLHDDNGIRTETFVEQIFGWHRNWAIKQNVIPIREPWVGIIHNPYYMPSFFIDYPVPREDIYFLESMEHCKGLYAMSEYHAKQLRYDHPDTLIESALHPYSNENPKQFSPYIYAKEKKLISVGWWLRKQTSIYRLPSFPHIRKIKLYPYEQNSRAHYAVRDKLYAEAEIYGATLQGVEDKFRIENDEYDRLLRSSVVFLDLWDTSANNTVIECVQRATPIICKRHEAVEEYLGKDYPLFFNSLNEVEHLLEYEQIKLGHEYMIERQNSGILSIDRFVQNIKGGKIYDLL